MYQQDNREDERPTELLADLPLTDKQDEEAKAVTGGGKVCQQNIMNWNNTAN